jgi:hypothetical protein
LGFGMNVNALSTGKTGLILTDGLYLKYFTFGFVFR